MGLMGVKLQLSKPYTLEELYDLIKDETFEAGKPYMASYGPAKYIVFPKLDRNNQVIIGGKNGNFNCMRSAQTIDVQENLTNVALDHLTGGLTSLSGVFGKTKKRCKELAENTGNQINAMNL